MDKSDRPQGRKKRVGSGGGGVFKRGEGTGGQTGGPVGDADGYSERTDGAQAPETDKPDKGVVKPSAGSLFGGGHGGEAAPPGVVSQPVPRPCPRVVRPAAWESPRAAPVAQPEVEAFPRVLAVSLLWVALRSSFWCY